MEHANIQIYLSYLYKIIYYAFPTPNTFIFDKLVGLHFTDVIGICF
jgi:hypothetical protein